MARKRAASISDEERELLLVLKRLSLALRLLNKRLTAADAWPAVRRTESLMAAAADGPSIDVQYAAILHLGAHAIESMVLVPDPTVRRRADA